jgi:hypothetical protein
MLSNHSLHALGLSRGACFLSASYAKCRQSPHVLILSIGASLKYDVDQRVLERDEDLVEPNLKIEAQKRKQLN